MKYINAIKGGFIALIIFIIATIYIPGKGHSEEVKIIITISTFLFAILASLFLSRANSRYNKIIELVAIEDAYWLSFYKSSIFFGQKFINKIRELIDKYYMVAYDFDAGDYYKYNAKYLHTIYDELNNVNLLKSEQAKNSFPEIISFLGKIEESRNKSSVLTLDKITKGQWAILYLLSGILIFSIFYLKIPALYSQVISVLLSTTVILVLLIIRDLENLRITGKAVLAESGQEIFEDIGKLRYYNQKYLKDGSMKIPKQLKEYRLGLHKPGEKLSIKTIRNK